jgi:outer membrane receptor protein involved in Fe transport
MRAFVRIPACGQRCLHQRQVPAVQQRAVHVTERGRGPVPWRCQRQHIPKSPRVQGNLSATYTAALQNGSAVDFNLTGIYSSSYFFEANNIAKQKAYGKLNASIAWNSADKKYTVRVFANNLTNAATAVYSSTLSDGTINVTYDAPRIVGIGFNVRY